MGVFAAAVPYIVAGATVASGVYSAVQTRNAGIIQKQQLESQARQEGDAARDREIERRRTLVRALASQAVEAGAMGVASVGSRKAIAMESLRTASRDSLADQAMTARKALLLKSQGSQAVKQGNLGAATTLLNTANDTYKTWAS